MTDDIISITAPLLPSDAPAADALARAFDANSFGIVENLGSAFRLHSIDAVAQAVQQAQGQRSITLGNLGAVQVMVVGIGEDPQGIGTALRGLGEDMLIRNVTSWGADAVAQIVGFDGPGRVLPNMLRFVWYECGNGCSDKGRYPNSGTCAFGHPLVQKP